MANPLYESMKGQSQPQMNFMQMLQRLKSNPAQFMRDRGVNLPDGVDLNNPQSILNGLMQSGQINNSSYQRLMQMMGGGRRR